MIFDLPGKAKAEHSVVQRWSGVIWPPLFACKQIPRHKIFNPSQFHHPSNTESETYFSDPPVLAWQAPYQVEDGDRPGNAGGRWDLRVPR